MNSSVAHTEEMDIDIHTPSNNRWYIEGIRFVMCFIKRSAHSGRLVVCSLCYVIMLGTSICFSAWCKLVGVSEKRMKKRMTNHMDLRKDGNRAC